MRLFKRKQHVNVPEVVYELKPGAHYLVEYDMYSVSMEMIQAVKKELARKKIFVIFVPNPSGHRAFHPVPATPQLASEQPKEGEE